MGGALRGAIAASAVAACLALSGPARAQGAAEIAMGKQVWLTQVNCKECHGTMANGVQDFALAPQGADLRVTLLSPEAMTEIIKCGKPASEMPYFSSRAWTGTTQCFGMTAAQVGAAKPFQAGSPLADRQIAALVAMIYAEFVGKGPATLERCVAFMGTETAKCREYPRGG